MAAARAAKAGAVDDAERLKAKTVLLLVTGAALAPSQMRSGGWRHAAQRSLAGDSPVW